MAPLIAEVGARLRSPEALLLWVPQHNALALALSGLALARPRRPPGPLTPGQEAVHLAEPAIAAVKRLLSVKWDFGRPLRGQVPDLPEGTTAVPEARYVRAQR